MVLGLYPIEYPVHKTNLLLAVTTSSTIADDDPKICGKLGKMKKMESPP